MRDAEAQLTAVLKELCDILHAIEDEQVRLFPHNRCLTRLERDIRDTLLRLLAVDFPEMVSEYAELNRDFDEARRIKPSVRGESCGR